MPLTASAVRDDMMVDDQPKFNLSTITPLTMGPMNALKKNSLEHNSRTSELASWMV